MRAPRINVYLAPGADDALLCALEAVPRGRRAARLRALIELGRQAEQQEGRVPLTALYSELPAGPPSRGKKCVVGIAWGAASHGDDPRVVRARSAYLRALAVKGLGREARLAVPVEVREPVAPPSEVCTAPAHDARRSMASMVSALQSGESD